MCFIKCPRTIWRSAKHMCIPGHECCSHFGKSFRNAGKGTRSPVPGTIVLSLSGHPPTLTLSCSLEIAKAPGPADVSRLGLRISAEPDILDKNLADKFCQSVQIDTLAANDVVIPVTSGQDVLPLPYLTTSLEHTNTKSRDRSPSPSPSPSLSP
jgi:hypothetical protein